VQIDGKAFMYYVSPTQINVVGACRQLVLRTVLAGPGLYRINVTVSAGLPIGDNSIVASVAGASTRRTRSKIAN
jgi:hypothetical protein